jgi:hypothetical protein
MPVNWEINPAADPGTNGDPSRRRPERNPSATVWVETIGGGE